MPHTSAFDFHFRSFRKAIAAGCIVLLLGVPLSLPVLFREQARPPLLAVGALIPSGAMMSFSGDSISTGIFSGRNTVLLFFSTSCPHCIRELENMRRLEPEFGDSLFIAAVSLNEKETVAHLVADQATPSHIFLDPQQSYARLFGITAVPAIFLIKKDGRVCYRRNGEAPIAADRQRMKELLGGGNSDTAQHAR